MSAEDKLAVAECMYRYATGVDTRDWAMYRSVFADEVEFDFFELWTGATADDDGR